MFGSPRNEGVVYTSNKDGSLPEPGTAGTAAALPDPGTAAETTTAAKKGETIVAKSNVALAQSKTAAAAKKKE